MAPDDDDTVIKRRRVGADDGVLEPDFAAIDQDTIIADRASIADVPAEALLGAERASPPALVLPPRTPPTAPPRPPAPTPPAAPSPPAASETCYRFRINSHEAIALDAPALIGRKPSVPRVFSGPIPRLVRVPSPLREVSSTHLELRQHGASVVATDLRSTNGTLVTIPGSATLKLRQGESVVVTAGTVVDIGDGNIVEILPLPA